MPRVVDVRGMVDAAALNHEEEALVALLSRLLQGADGSGGHLAQARVHVVHVPAVQLERDVPARKETHQRQGHVLAALEVVESGPVVQVRPPVVLLGRADHVVVVLAAAASRRVGQEVAAAAPEHQIDDATKRPVANLLDGDVIVQGPQHDVASEACRGRVSEIRSDHQARHVARALGRLEHGAAGLVVGWEYRNGTVVALGPARKGRGARRAVRHQRVGRPRPAAAPEVAVERQGVVDRQAVDVLAEATGQGQRGGAHAVRDHEDQVALVGESSGLGLGAVLGPDGEDDDGGGGEEGPDEEYELAEARDALGAIVGAVGGVVGGLAAGVGEEGGCGRWVGLGS